MASRRTQPYRRGARTPGPVLRNMKRGATLFGQNPTNRRRKRGKLSQRVAKHD